MAKLSLFAIFTIFSFCEISNSVDLDCKFGIDAAFTVVGSTYLCTSSNKNIISQESAIINKIIGTHTNSNTNENVLGFYASNQVINYFPKGLDKFFKNIQTIIIQTIIIWSSKLKEIHQSDLKPFPQLIYLNLWNNDLEILEEGILDFNPNLQVVSFDDSKIIHISPNIFDNLNKLSYLWLKAVPCINKNSNNQNGIQSAIQTIKLQCSSSEFTTLNSQIQSLESESKTLNSDEFSKKLSNFEKTLSNSKFSKFRPLSNKFQNLKNLNIATTPAPRVPSTSSSLFLASSPDQAAKCTNCCQVNDIHQQMNNLTIDLMGQIGNFGVSAVKKSLNDVTSKLKAIDASQLDTQSSIVEIKLSLEKIEMEMFKLKEGLEEKLGNLDDKLAKILDKVW